MATTYTVKDLCDRYHVREHTVFAWIRNGEIAPLNVGVTPGKQKPRYRFTAEAIEQFELLRTQSAPPPPRRRRKRQASDTINFY